jgi:hypothetical protein
MARLRHLVVDGRRWAYRHLGDGIEYRRPGTATWTRYLTRLRLDDELIANIIRGRGARTDTAGEALAHLTGR